MPPARPDLSLDAIRRRHVRDAPLITKPPDVGRPLTFELARVLDEALIDRMHLLKAAERAAKES